MPVMRQLEVGGVTYDTVGEASVTQVQTSGTKIATVSIDGTSTDLYAPEGGSSVEPSSTTPAMDGTAAVGTATTYARADHVHPTDTSRAAASHSHAISDVTSLQTTLDGKAASTHSHAIGDLPTGTTSSTVALGNHTHSGYQATLVSGTNIKTINNESLLGSGNISTPTYTLPTASTSTLGGVKVDGTTITAAADGTISAAGGGGANRLTLYLSDDLGASTVIVYVDQAKTTTLYDEFEGDYRAAYSALRNFDDVELVYEPSSNNKHWYRVLSMRLDAVDDTLYLTAATATANPQLKNVYM